MHQENFSMNKEFKYQSDPRENANVSEDPIRNNADNNAHTCNNSSNSSIHDYICFEICIPPNILTGEPGFIGDLICFRICIYPTIFNGYSYFCSSIYDKSRSSEKENFFFKISTNGIDLIIYSSYLEKENNDLEREKNNLAVTKDYSHLWVQCEICYALNYRRFLKSRMHVCEQCGYHLKMTSAERIELSIDPGTWDAMDDGMVSLDPIGFDSDEMKYSGSISQTNPSSIYFLSSKKYIYSQEGGYERNTNKKSLSQNWKDNCEKQGERSKMDSKNDSNPLDDIDFDSSNIDSNQYLDSSKDIHLAQKVDEKEEDKAPSNIDLHSEQDDRPFNMDFCSPEKQKRNRALAELEAKEALEKVEAKEAFAELERDFHVNFFDDILSTYSKEGKEPDNDQPYKDRIISYQKDTGLTEAVQTGTGQLNGIPVAIGVMDFQFIGGSMGSVVGEKITRLVEYATNNFLPLILVCASGGARMQEGSLSLMQMAKISSALYDYQSNKKLFFVSILTSPTTGGVTASFGMLGDIIIAEPKAYIAFAGKRVIEQTLNTTVPEGSQEAELLFEKGLFDPILPRNLLKGVLSDLFQFHGFLPLKDK